MLTATFFLFLVEGEGEEGGEEAEVSSEVVKEASPPSENPDQEVIVEGLKSICNILLHNETGQVGLLCVSSYLRSHEFLRLYNRIWLVPISKLCLWMDGWMAGGSSRSAADKGCGREAEAVS